MNRWNGWLSKTLSGLLLCGLTWTAAAEVMVLEMQPGSARAARYSLGEAKKMNLDKLEKTLSQKISAGKERFRVAVLVDNRVSVGDIASLHSVMQKTGFADVRYFRFAASDKTRLSEIRLNFAPVVARQRLEQIMDRGANRDPVVGDAYF